jgi:hypothetical protein
MGMDSIRLVGGFLTRDESWEVRTGSFRLDAPPVHGG